MKVLALDTALDACSAALVVLDADGVVLKAVSATDPMTKGQAERLLPLYETLKAEAGWDAPPDRIAVTVGPGTFTGSRVGLSAARAMALAWNCPCLGVSSLEALAASCTAPVRIAAHDARRGQLFAQVFQADGPPLTAPLALAVSDFWDEVAPLIPAGAQVIGSGASALAAAAPNGVLTVVDRAAPDPERLARFALGDPEQRPPNPLYLRPPDAVPAKPPAWMQSP